MPRQMSNQCQHPTHSFGEEWREREELLSHYMGVHIISQHRATPSKSGHMGVEFPTCTPPGASAKREKGVTCVLQQDRDTTRRPASMKNLWAVASNQWPYMLGSATPW